MTNDLIHIAIGAGNFFNLTGLFAQKGLWARVPNQQKQAYYCYQASAQQKLTNHR
jgi:hypothetical protein